jgi:predicted enzyme related to lactoylglutathione lyase
MNRPIHFETPADDVDRAIAFYQATFGWKFTKWDGPAPYWLVDTGQGQGINGGMLVRERKGQSTVNTMDVADLDASIATVIKNGGAIAVPRMPIPGMGWLAYCTDTEGNTFGMMQGDPNAK